MARKEKGDILLYCRMSPKIQVGATGFEPATSWSQTRRSSQAELRPAASDAAQLNQAREWQSSMVASRAAEGNAKAAGWPAPSDYLGVTGSAVAPNKKSGGESLRPRF